jgi:hypothetical protein
MIERAGMLMVYGLAGAAVLAAIYGAATFAVQRDGLIAIDAVNASRLSADYTSDEHAPVLPPLDPAIIEEVADDEQQLPPLPGAPQSAPSPSTATSTPTRVVPSVTPLSGGSAGGPLSPTPLRPTSTPQPDATDTPRPQTTATPPPQPSATHTPDVKPTETPVQKPTDTPSPTRTPRGCPIIDLPPALDGLFPNCRTHTPTPVKSPTPTRTPIAIPTKPTIELPDLDDILDCTLGLFCD